jgi:hypothetical protein
MVHWLAASIVLSVALTLALNIALRLFPGSGQRLFQAFNRLVSPPADPADNPANNADRRVRVFVPWKAMIVGSLVLTVAINLTLLLR